MGSDAMSRTFIRQLLGELNDELALKSETGELYLVGGAVMCLVFDARATTRDVDAYYRPVEHLRAAATRVGARHDLPENWLNDAVRGYLSDRGEFTSYLGLSHLQVFSPTPEYLLAMKAMTMRLGAEFRDERDVRFLLRLLDVRTVAAAMAIVTSFHPHERIPVKLALALEELLGE